MAEKINKKDVLYRGYENKFNLGQIGSEVTYELQAINCELIKINPESDDQGFIIKTKSSEKTAVINFVVGDEILGSIEFDIKTLPRPIAFWGNQPEGSVTSHSSELTIDYECPMNLEVSFEIERWTSTHDSNSFEGEGNILSQELLSYVETLASGEIIEMMLTVKMMDGSSRRKAAAWRIM